MESIKTVKQNCYNCKYRTEVPGSVHSSCSNPLFNISELKLLMIHHQLKGVMYKNPTGIRVDDEPVQDWHETGLKKGYVLFPYNFDPVWLNYCKIFENK